MWQETAITSTYVRQPHDTHTKLKGLQIQQADLNFLQGISVLLMNNAKDYSGRTDHRAYLQHHYPKTLHLLI